ncbi:hypothetical protein SteCoe_15230 [Stentor coeruleus]|uniref:Uncharacterized protein n=1 Tax=Stentor coeruleus TaxID=5963 RepID=A0A1R2C401_9CILI|nr:hypothetical protein SteCoe_15230 [Stentor coeruleus]
MGGSLTKLLLKIFSRKKLNICMLGLESAGKTTILYKLHLGEVIATCPTVGFNIETIKYKKLNLAIWDVSGDMRYRVFWATYYQNAHGLIFVIDAEDREKIETAKDELYHVLEHNSVKNAPILVLANKQDLPGAMSAMEVLEKLQMFKIRDRPWHLQATCALSGEGLSQGLNRLVQMINNKRT